MPRARTKLLYTTLLAGGLFAGMAPFAPPLFAPAAQAQQRVEIRQEFRVALEPHGRFERHARYGEVWRPARVERDWRPYTVGRWVYTDDWGWYWNADDAEADWGWVVFHYGRWIDDRKMGWVWVPGNEWGPAWVGWRRGEGPAAASRGDARYIGWAPLPPDDVVVEYRDNPDVWTFVRARDIVAPRVNTVIIRDRRPEILQRTVVVNRTVVVRDRGVIVNPGIPPTYIAAFAGRPIVSYEVRPRVIAGTARINNAIELRADDLRDRNRLQKQRPVIRETRTRIEAVRDVPAPRALEANEQGRLGERPPRAAQRGAGDAKERATGEGAGPDRRAPLAPGERPSTTTQDRRDLAPGRDGARPGQAGAAPEREGVKPGQERTAPGRQDRSTTERAKPDGSQADRAKPDRAAPDRTPQQSGAKPPARDEAKPGAPSRATDAPARQQDRGAQQREERSKQERGAQQREERSKQERGAQQREERSPPQQQRQDRAGEQRGGGGESKAAAPQRGGGDGAREQRAPQRSGASESRREREKQ